MGITYEIIKENCDNCQCIVIPIAYTNPLEDIDTLISKLSQEDIHSGNIIFDFIMSSGNTNERYAKVLYDNGFVNGSFEYIQIASDDPIREKCSKYLLKRINEGKATMLSSSQQALLKNGYSL